jgi:hypothetical protein
MNTTLKIQRGSVRAFMRRTVTPTVALIASIFVCVSSAWIFVVVFAGLPRGWASALIGVGFIAPALAFVSTRELWRSGWDIRLLFTTLLSAVGFAFWCTAMYLVIHPHAA